MKLEPGAESEGDVGSVEDAPISPQLFHILLSLADAPRHGYGILLEVEERTDGRISLGTGTVYSVIKRLRRLKWIEEYEVPASADHDARRKSYQLTQAGRRAMTREARRLEGMVAQARLKAVLPETAP